LSGDAGLAKEPPMFDSIFAATGDFQHPVFRRPCTPSINSASMRGCGCPKKPWGASLGDDVTVL